MLDAVKLFLDEKRPKLESMKHRYHKLPNITFVQDRAVMTQTLALARNSLNESVSLQGDVEMLLGATEKLQILLNATMDEQKILLLTNAEWIKEKNAIKLAKDERDLIARLEKKELYDAQKELNGFMEEVKSLKRSVGYIVNNYESLRKDCIGYVWLLIKDDMYKGGIQPTNTNIEEDKVEDYLNPKKH